MCATFEPRQGDACWNTFHNASRFRDEIRSKNSPGKLAIHKGHRQLGSNCPNPKPPPKTHQVSFLSAKFSRANLTPYTLHPTPCTLHPAPYTLQPAPYTLNPKPLALTLLPYLYTRSTSPSALLKPPRPPLVSPRPSMVLKPPNSAPSTTRGVRE